MWAEWYRSLAELGRPADASAASRRLALSPEGIRRGRSRRRRSARSSRPRAARCPGGRRGGRIRPSASSSGGKAGRGLLAPSAARPEGKCCASSSTTLARYPFGLSAARASSRSRPLRRPACGPSLRAVGGEEAVVVDLGAAGEAAVGILVVNELPHPELAAAFRAEALLEREAASPPSLPRRRRGGTPRGPAPGPRRRPCTAGDSLAPRSRAESAVAPRW